MLASRSGSSGRGRTLCVRDTRGDTRRDPLASYSGGILGGIRWRATLQYSAGYSTGSTGLLWWDTRRDPLASCSDGITGELLCGILSGIGGEPLWWDTQWDRLASCSGGILDGIHWRAGLEGYWAGCTGRMHWRAVLAGTWRDPLASSSGGILGGTHWRATLGYSAGYSAGSTGGILGGIHWRAGIKQITSVGWGTNKIPN